MRNLNGLMAALIGVVMCTEYANATEPGFTPAVQEAFRAACVKDLSTNTTNPSPDPNIDKFEAEIMCDCIIQLSSKEKPENARKSAEVWTESDWMILVKLINDKKRINGNDIKGSTPEISKAIFFTAGFYPAALLQPAGDKCMSESPIAEEWKAQQKQPGQLKMLPEGSK
jgi:hypothetical protein